MKKFAWFVAGAAGGLAGVFAIHTQRRYRREMRVARERVRSGSQVIDTAHGPIEYTTWGNGPPVLVIHGAGGGYDQADARTLGPARL